MQTNVFLNDPLLSNNPYMQNVSDLDSNIQRLQQAQQQIEQQKQLMLNPQRQQQQQSNTPVWDDIDRFIDEMSDSELEALKNDVKYKQAQDNVMFLLNKEYMKIMRPVVEQTKEGKEALENLFGIAKQVKKTASEEINKNMALFNEYTAHYADMPYADFLKMKKEEKTKGGKK